MSDDDTPLRPTRVDELVVAVADLAARHAAWLVNRGSCDVVEATVAEHMATVRQTQEAAGLLVPTATFQRVETEYRQQLDREAEAEGSSLATDLDVLADRLSAHVESQESLRSLAEGHATTSAQFLAAATLDELQSQRASRELSARTQAQVLERYERLDDWRDNALVRAIETAVLSGDWSPLAVVDDPERDALSIARLQAAVRTRRAARVSPEVREARDRLSALQSSSRFSVLVEHLRSGKGLAMEPTTLTVTARSRASSPRRW